MGLHMSTTSLYSKIEAAHKVSVPCGVSHIPICTHSQILTRQYGQFINVGKFTQQALHLDPHSSYFDMAMEQPTRLRAPNVPHPFKTTHGYYDLS
jgi:hypothetical protein